MTFRQLITIIIITAGLSLTGCSTKDEQPTPSVIKAFKMSGDEPGASLNNIRRTAIINTATSIGAQAGLAWKAQQIDENLTSDSKKLDNIFNFRVLMLKDNVLPPVLSSGKDAVNLDSNTTLRLADQVYKIVTPPKFVTAPPNWREYLWMSYEKPETPNSTLLPENAEERALWNKYITIGWKQGIEQAEQIFSVNLGRLKRDYEGMVLYRQLLAQNMVTAPFVAQANLGVTGNANELRINDKVLRITATSELNTNSNNWRPAMTVDNTNKAILEPPRYLK